MHYALVNKNYMADVSCLLGIFPLMFDLPKKQCHKEYIDSKIIVFCCLLIFCDGVRKVVRNF